MLKSLSPGSWKLPDLMAAPETLASLPASVRRAVRLMLTGAAVTAVWGVYVAVLTAVGPNYMIGPNGKKMTITGAQLTTSVIFMIAVTLILTAAWVLMARMAQQGRNWARFTSTALFLLWSYVTFLSIGGVAAGAAVLVEVVILIAIWVIGVCALFLLWRPESSAYFSAARDR